MIRFFRGASICSLAYSFDPLHLVDLSKCPNLIDLNVNHFISANEANVVLDQVGSLERLERLALIVCEGKIFVTKGQMSWQLKCFSGLDLW